MARTYRLGFGRRLINALATAALRLGIAPRGNYLLTTTGRKSGKRHTNPVTVMENGERFLVAPYGPVPWVHNARAAGEVSLTRGRKTTTHSITEVGPAEAAPVLKRYVKKVPVVRPFFDAGKDAPMSDFESEAARHPVFRLGPAR
jgi:deazaflavin-dependent oxidoreductase (nitroreductase family)